MEESLGDLAFDRRGLINRVQGNRELLKRIVEFLQEDGPMLLRPVLGSITKKDAIGLSNSLNNLKSLVGNFGATHVLAVILAIEEMGYKSEFHEAEAEYDNLEREVARLETDLTAFVAGTLS